MTTRWRHNVQVMSNGDPATNSKNAWGGGQWHNNLTSILEGDKKGERSETGFPTPPITSTFPFMPHDDASRYFVPGAFGTHTISRILACPTLVPLIALACILVPTPVPFL